MSALLMKKHNIVDVAELIQDSTPFNLKCNNTEDLLFLEEVKSYLDRYPNTNHVDVYLHDLNGHVRGKRIDIACLKKVVQESYFPLSIYAMSLNGEIIEETGLGRSIGEPDCLCKPVPGSLQPCALKPELNAQLFLSMKDDQNNDCPVEPRNILKKVLNSLHQQNFYPCMAAELEFYLVDGDSACSSNTTYLNQCFDVNVQDRYQEVLDEIERIAILQNIHITGLVSESSSGQYEINIQHSKNILKLCDQIMMLKRTIKQIAVNGELEKMYKDRAFSPLSLPAAVAQASYVYENLTSNGIEVIRIGLQADEELCKEDNIIAGPFHPSFGEMVKSFQYRCWVAEQLEELDGNISGILIAHNSKITSQLKGIKKCNEKFWQRIIDKQDVTLLTDDSLQEAVIKLNMSAE